MMKRIILFSLIIFIHHTCISQKFPSIAQLPKVNKDGFYKIPMTPDLVASANVNFSNMRIFDNENHEIPYLIQQDTRETTEKKFEDYSLVSKKQIRDSCTVVIWSNPLANEIGNVSLSIKNAEVNKEATLSGSEDLLNWFALKQTFTLSNINNPDGTTEVRIVDFPLSNYKYYRLWINDKGSQPINILNAGYYRTEKGLIDYFSVPAGRFAQTDSADRKSYVRLEFGTARLIDKISWNVSTPSYYLRDASLFYEDFRIDKRGQKAKYLSPLASFQLRSGIINQVKLSPQKLTNLLLIVNNEDSPPLKINAFDTFQSKRYTLVRLEKNKTYEIRFSDEFRRKPIYDLEYFRDSLRLESELLEAGVPRTDKEDTKNAPHTIFTSDGIIWLSIAGVISLLGFMSYRLIQEMSLRK